MRKSDILPNALAYLVYIILACLTSTVASAFLAFILNKTVGLEYPVRAAIVAISSAVICGIILYTLAYRDGYRTAEYRYRDIAYPLTIAVIAHYLISLALSFSPVVSGGVRYLAGLISLGKDFTANSSAKDIGFPACSGAFMIYFCIYAGVITSAYYMGYKKRRADRAELTGGQSG
ncbi:MAG: hypothetical protein ACOX31_05805 [Eubacteriales bacterium]|jgi:hypothetical protein